MKDIYTELEKLSHGVLLHFQEDLTVHDAAVLATVCKPGQSWLWVVHKCGTHLVRWDSDPNAGTKLSYLECLIRAAQRGSWPEGMWHLFHVKTMINDQPFGTVTGCLDVNDIANALPRPKHHV
jgi:hypothetical protein